MSKIDKLLIGMSAFVLISIVVQEAFAHFAS